MAHRRSPPTRSHNPLPVSSSPTSSSPARRRKYTPRTTLSSRRRALGLLHPTRSTGSHPRRVVETQSDDSDDDEKEEDGRLRPVLAALHQNLRRLPSRVLLAAASSAARHNHKRDNTTIRERDISMRDVEETVQIGTKRKRVASSNENLGGHSTRSGASRPKRIKATTRRQQQSQRLDSSSSDEEMEVDTPTAGTASDDSDADEDAVDSSDDHLLATAPPRQLLRLRKDELVHLYTIAGLTPPSSFESLTKPEIVDAIIAAREDNESLDGSVELPPSSPRAGSECSSEGEVEVDDGNVAGGEETDASMGGGSRRTRMGANSLKRRATVNELVRGGGTARPIKGRSVSMGQLGESSKGGRRRASSRSSPTTTTTTTSMSHHRVLGHATGHHAHLPSPPATRTRSRKVSNDTSSTSTSANGRPKLAANGKGKGKAKQVEFSDDVEVQVASPLSMQSDEDEERMDQLDIRSHELKNNEDGEADLDSEPADLAKSDREPHETPRARSSKIRAGSHVGGRVNGVTMPSPRRLRSRSGDAARAAINVENSDTEDDGDAEVVEGGKDRRVTLMRKAKGKIGSLKEDSESVEEGEDDEEETVDDGEAEEEVEEECMGEDEEVDELASSPSPTPPPLRGRRTPVKKRLRPRRVQTYTPPSDGDDEDDDETEDTAVDVDEVASVNGSEGEVYEDAEDGHVPVSTTPRKLRSGRIVGEEEVDEDEDESIGEEDEEESEEEFVDAESIDVNDTEEDTDEPMEDDIDLTIATTKTLVRLRRDDLVRLCETHDLDPVGTKPQLASALLEWRDRHSQSGFSSPSSTGTIRPPSTIKRRRKSSSGGTKYHQAHTNPTTPILLRSHHFHADEPRTPPMSDLGNGSGGKDQEPELELDLESLGLEDREIAPEKLTKLEKIGSGGFKDVFIGKLKGRKVAISEFRGQLSAMDIKELKLLGGFDHPNIVRFLGVSIPENTRETPVMMISELCANGDLFDYVRNVHPPSLHKVLNMMLDIARGLEYLHLRKPSVIHRDCKSSNILITSRGTAKIADFGLAKVKQSTRSMVRSLVGTVNWQAPELWHAHPKYNHKVDVFSCAMVYWEMLQWHVTNKKFPWEGMNEHAIYDIVGAKRQRPSINGLRKTWCSEIVDLIERMWAQEHQDRPTMSEVVEELEQMVQR